MTTFLQGQEIYLPINKHQLRPAVAGGHHHELISAPDHQIGKRNNKGRVHRSRKTAASEPDQQEINQADDGNWPCRDENMYGE